MDRPPGRKPADLPASERASQPVAQTMAHGLAERHVHARSSAPAAPAPLDDELRSVAQAAFSELDAGELQFSLADSRADHDAEGTWHTVEIGASGWRPAPAPTTPPPPSFLPLLAQAGTPAMLVAPYDRTAALHPTGVALVRVDEGDAFAVRLDGLRVLAGPPATQVLPRRTRDADTREALGGAGSPMVRVAGPCQLVVGGRQARELTLLALEQELAFVREDALVGFALSLAYENGRVGLDPDVGGPNAPAVNTMQGVSVVQLRGTGAAILELAGKLAGVTCSPGAPLLVRREGLIGWLGRLVPRPLPAAESPNGVRGLIAFSGEGTVLVCIG
jgi:hypothetical protein